MIHNLRKLIHIALGIILVLLGIAGLVLPIINGTILLIIGFIIISFENPTIEKHLYRITKKNTMIHHWHLKLDKILRKLFRK
jgi:uncharacterized membrane protein YbaN (DUF454 family)